MNGTLEPAGRPRVAVLGLGRMGWPLAGVLRQALGSVVVWNRTPESSERFAAEGTAGETVVARSPADAARQADVILTMLADGDALMSVLLGRSGVLEAARPGTVVVDMGTSGPDAVRRAARAAENHRVSFVDAPVSGSVAAVISRRLVVMAGGPDAAVEKVRPLLDLVAQRVVHVGGTGSGAVLKLCVNSLLVTLNAGIGEAVRLAEMSGLDRQLAYDVFVESAAGAPFLTYKRTAFLDADRSTVAFSLDLVAKDVGLALSLAASAGVDTPVLRAVGRQVDDARAEGRGGEDMSSVAWSGVPLA